MIPTEPRPLTTSAFGRLVGVAPKRLREWVRRRLLTPAKTGLKAYYLWAESDVAAAIRVCDEYRARFNRLAVAITGTPLPRPIEQKHDRPGRHPAGRKFI